LTGYFLLFILHWHHFSVAVALYHR